ncbi:TPA: LysM domain-containing protein, partial [Vibrio parahaemolyticus]
AIAKRIGDSKEGNVERMRQWVEKLPPETLCNLLNCLVQHQDSSDENYKQAQAIVQVMQWLADDDKEQGEAKQRQWKEALIAMGNLPKGEKNYPLEWQTYKEQWFRLASFVKEFGGQYNNVLENLFNRSSKKLCGNMVLTKVSEYRR